MERPLFHASFLFRNPLWVGISPLWVGIRYYTGLYGKKISKMTETPKGDDRHFI
jgi:hypothetical protein